MKDYTYLVNRFKHDEVLSTTEVMSRISDDVKYDYQEIFSNVFSITSDYNVYFHVWKNKGRAILVLRMSFDSIWNLEITKNDILFYPMKDYMLNNIKDVKCAEDEEDDYFE